jgi:mono/diheme cytochrome c family protein
MMNQHKPDDTPEKSPQRQRELADPDEGVRPLPWFLTMFLGAMAMWGAFYIYSTPSGEESSYGDQRTTASLRPPEVAVNAAQKADGKQIYGAKCAACHQASGLGIPGVFPPLAGSEWVVGDEKILTLIMLHGVNGEMEVKGTVYKGAMPAWKSLSDGDLAAVMSYIRSDWGNKSAEIAPDTVATQRDATKSRTEPYQGGQELKSGG